MSICDGAFLASKRKIVAQYVEFLENSIIEHETKQTRLASNPLSSEEFAKKSKIGNKSEPPPMITRQYFDLLLTFSHEMLKMSSALSSDKALLQSVDGFEKKLTTDSGVFIRHCVMFDLSRIFKILLGSNIDEKLVEISSLAFVASDLTGSSDFIKSVDYEKFIELHNQGKWNETAQAIIDIAASSNPISMSIRKGDESPVVRDADFSLPSLLIYSGNPLFDKYAVTLCQFATVIAKADGVISGNEDTLLKEIYHSHPTGWLN